MGKMAKTSILLIVALLIATLVSTGPVLAAGTCQEDCSVSTKSGAITVGILPDTTTNQWPVVVNEPGLYLCDDPDVPDSDNYPCLAWPYQCISGPCAKITKGNILIPNCCDKPIEILWTSHGDPINNILTCDQVPQSSFQNVCSGYELRLPNNAGSKPGLIFWFTTPKDIGTNMIDITIPIGSKLITCLTGIKGPGCNTPIEPVRVEPRIQCFQFKAENQPESCTQPASSTWRAEWDGIGGKCAVRVWAAYGDEWNCDNVKVVANELTGEPLGDIVIWNPVTVEYDTLTHALTTNTECDESWLRFEDVDGCNARCYVSGGRKYCR